MEAFKKPINNFFTNLKLFILKGLKRLLKGLKIGLPALFVGIVWFLFVFIHLAVLFVPYWIVILPLIYLVIILVNKYRDFRFYKEIKANTIVYGGRGSGKGLLFQKAIASEKKAFSNIPYGDNTEVIDPIDYFGSITPNTAEKFLQGEITIIDKNEEYEGVPYYSDDTNTIFPNYLDYILKRHYQSIGLFLPLQRHFYNSYTVFNAQNISRIWIHIRELQLDGYLKALKTNGTGNIWNRLPILRNYMRVKYRFYENVEAAEGGLLPFEKLGLLNKAASPLYLTAGEATKEQYEAKNGKISDNIIWINKDIIRYDTRYYHYLFFDKKAPKNENMKPSRRERKFLINEKKKMKKKNKLDK